MTTFKRLFLPCILLLAVALFLSAGCGRKNRLASISVAPEYPVVVKGTAVQLIATAVFSDDMTLSSWQIVNWTSSDPSVATVSNLGLVSTLAAGTTVITATDAGHPDISASITLVVTETALSSIVLSLPSTTLAAGASQQMTATGVYTAPTPTLDLTRTVSWSSSDPAVATAGNSSGSKGFSTAVSAGTATIFAVDPYTGITGTASLTVL